MIHKADSTGMISNEASLLLDQAKQSHIVLRLVGSQAIVAHCEAFKFLFARAARPVYDIDFATYSGDDASLHNFMMGQGYVVDQQIVFATEGRRRIYTKQAARTQPMIVDIFFDELDFCHRLDLRGRLTLSYPTIPLADLWLSKLQIHTIATRDLIDVSILMLEHDVTPNRDDEVIDLSYIVQLLARDWGFYHTVELNLDRVADFVKHSDWLQTDWKRTILGRAERLLFGMAAQPKSKRWRLRSLAGETIAWYKNVSNRDPIF